MLIFLTLVSLALLDFAQSRRKKKKIIAEIDSVVRAPVIIKSPITILTDEEAAEFMKRSHIVMYTGGSGYVEHHTDGTVL